jgi:hypothetical protein
MRCLKKRYAAMPKVVVKKLATTNRCGLMKQAISIPKPKNITPIGYSLILICNSQAANRHIKPSMINIYACLLKLLEEVEYDEILLGIDDQVLNGS